MTDNVVAHDCRPLMRYCSAKGVAPGAVDETVVDAFMEYRARSTARPVKPATRRLLARAWNANVGTHRELARSASRRISGPVGCQAGMERAFPRDCEMMLQRYLEGLKRRRRSRRGQRIRPLKPSTIDNRRNELTIAARTAVRLGVPIESLTSSERCWPPTVARKILDAYWQKNGETPKTFTIDLGMRFLSIARETDCVDEADVKNRRDGEAMEEHRQTGSVGQEPRSHPPGADRRRVWDRVVNLPQQADEQWRDRNLITHPTGLP